ncbi:MAG TPA: helix-turn-helix transcriptional regulator [Acidimicrobiales bacterium]
MAGTGKGVTPRQRLFGDRVRQRRLALDLSQEGLAHKAGLHRTYIGSLETGDRNPSLDLIARLAKALGCDAADLVKGTQSLPGREAPSC